ncbi:kinase-like domain-containing protein [Mycena capillaripes]|nr:kinase-like domain-containing protein [Mycena capillaripes]
MFIIPYDLKYRSTLPTIFVMRFDFASSGFAARFLPSWVRAKLSTLSCSLKAPVPNLSWILCRMCSTEGLYRVRSILRVTDHDEHPTFCGGFGDIYRASFSGNTVALKRIRRFNVGTESPNSRLQFCREALVWQTLRHKYILPLIGIDRDTFPSSFCMVSPWMKHGTVLKYLREYGRVNVEKMLLQIAEGLSYLHSMKIVHGDLRGTNILVSDDWNVCLADFGLTGVIGDSIATSGALTSSTNHAGSLRWFAPELIAPTLFGCTRFVRSSATDVYAFACVCLELYTGSPPFSDVSPDVAAMLKVVAGERPARPAAMSDKLWELLTAAWAQQFLDRPDITQIIESMKALLDSTIN